MCCLLFRCHSRVLFPSLTSYHPRLDPYNTIKPVAWANVTGYFPPVPSRPQHVQNTACNNNFDEIQLKEGVNPFLRIKDDEASASAIAKLVGLGQMPLDAAGFR